MSQNLSDPYQPPDMRGAPPASMDIDAMRSVANWQRFFSVLGYIISGIVALILPVQVIIAASSNEGPAALVGALVATVFAIGMTVLVYVIPSVLLGGASKASREFGEGRISLGEYATKQKKFWRYTGIVVSVIMALYLALIAVVVVMGVVVGASSQF